MRIRRHLFFYNTVSVLVALVAMLAVNSAATHAIARYYQRQAEEMFQAMRVNIATQEGMVWLDRGMGELELVGAIQSLRVLTTDLLVHLAKVCGPCDNCGAACPCMGDEEALRPSDALLAEAGIPKGAKLDVFAEEGVIHITAADGPDLRDVPADLLELFRQTGICLDELDGLLRENEVVYGG